MPLLRLLRRCAGVALVAAGVVLLPLPIPLGLLCIGFGLILLGRRWTVPAGRPRRPRTPSR